MAAFKLFQINDGEPKILSAFFHKEKHAFDRDEAGKQVPSEVVIYGTSSTRDPVYLHLLIEDLTGANKTRVQDDLQLAVDLFAVNAHETPKRRADNRLSVELEEGLLAFTLDLAIGKQDLANSPTTLKGIFSTSKGHTVKKEPEVVVTALGPLDTHPLHHLTIEIPIEDDDLASLVEQPAYSKRVLAWCWLISKHTKAKYAEGFWGNRGTGGVDIAGREARMAFLQNGSSPLQSLLSYFADGQRMQSRAEHSEAALPPGCGDPFVYDEPTANSVRFSKFFPFASIEMGSQLGSTGLCSNNIETYYKNAFLHSQADLLDPLERLGNFEYGLPDQRAETWHQNVLLIDGKSATVLALPKNLDLRDASYPFAVNELQHTYEHQYLFRESSAAQWLNTLEPAIAVDSTREPQPAPNSVVDPGALRCIKSTKYDKASKLVVLSFDMLADYTAHVPDRASVGTKIIVEHIWEQKELDLSEYQSISIPSADLCTESGECLLRLGKGFPFPGGGQGFLPNWLHTKVKIEGDGSDCRWQAHPYCHRPILLSYELERDLRPEEEKKLAGAWRSGKPQESVGITLTLPGATKDRSLAGSEVTLPLPFLDSRCGEKGKHLVMLYLTSPISGRLYATLHSNGLAECPPTNENILGGIPGDDRKARHEFRTLQFQMAGTPSLVTYQVLGANGAPLPQLPGLFEGNPVISIESWTPLETRANLLAADTRKFEYDSAAVGGKFVLSFLPTYGSAAGSLWELAVKWADYASDKSKKVAPRGKSIEVGSEVLKTLFGEMLKLTKVKIFAWPGWKAVKPNVDLILGDSKAVGTLLDKLDNDLATLRKKIESEISPLKRSADFQKSPYERDELILIRALKKEWTLEAGSGAVVGKEKTPEEALVAFYARAVNLPSGTRTPFTYCFGPQGGLLERLEPARSSSIDELRQDYFLNLREYKKQADAARLTALAASRAGTQALSAEVGAGELTLEGHLRWLADPAYLKATKLNGKLKEFFQAHAGELAAASGLRSKLVGKTKVANDKEAEELGRLLATMHLWTYLHSTVIICPACGNVMQMNWGWCPYHPAIDDSLLVLEDTDKSGTWKDEFLALLRTTERVQGRQGLGNPRVADYLAKAKLDHSPERLLVHCSEFIVRE